MTIDVSDLFSVALALPMSDREALLDQLAVSLGDVRADDAADSDSIDHAWDAEVRSRVDDIITGKVQSVPAEQVDADIDRILAELP